MLLKPTVLHVYHGTKLMRYCDQQSYIGCFITNLGILLVGLKCGSKTNHHEDFFLELEHDEQPWDCWGYPMFRHTLCLDHL